MTNTPADPWIVQQPKAKYEPLPIGFYFGVFKGVEEVKLENSPEPKWRWTWEVAQGPSQGKAATALTDRSISPTSLPGVLIAGLLGRQLVAGENVKAAIDGCKGLNYMVSVQAGPKGGKPQVRAVSTPPKM